MTSLPQPFSEAIQGNLQGALRYAMISLDVMEQVFTVHMDAFADNLKESRESLKTISEPTGRDDGWVEWARLYQPQVPLQRALRVTRTYVDTVGRAQQTLLQAFVTDLATLRNRFIEEASSESEQKAVPGPIRKAS